MTVYFVNNNYKYETEAVLKIFCPLERFSFVYDHKPCKGRDTVIISDGSDGNDGEALYVYADIGGVSGELSEDIHREADRRSRELSLCRMLFRVLRDITGVSPEWGCLTGVRPIKLANSIISRGADMEGLCRELSEKYFGMDITKAE